MFSHCRHVFARCDESVKDFGKIFSAIESVFILFRKCICDSSKLSVFSSTLLNGGSKKTNCEGNNYLANRKSYGKSLYEVSTGNPGRLSVSCCSNLTPNDLGPRVRDTADSNFGWTSIPPDCMKRTEIGRPPFRLKTTENR